MPIRIVPATLRDLSYIAANLRAEDRAEIDCQLDHWTPALLALTALQGFAYVAELDGNPEAGFGAAEQRSGLWIAWSWGTRRMKRCVPEITRFFHAVLGPQVAARGAWRVEARALADNDLALRWLDRLGATRRCRLPGYGRTGEDFFLHDWTRESWNHVSLSTETTGTEAAAAGADRAGQGRAGARSSIAR
ncbi:hypothetical protein EN828_27050 [Mesorhizobium sp. M2D.F.Ca.ET.185.01.1.1]|uniref:hypothetical protein n=1 Tax=unclassified Mesorhizobium TaxID=325217 RepID=UPI000FCADBB7|nr:MULTISPECIES: hypothetical protein [unclassified Mesorhizobium]TGP74742.1 hypothetical protein EN870_26080 [bacterium M00.F.Ca.ET.227.01.1.1]TGP84637.1 hypothetical protein EN864_28885 [bacterium M00.F.Ca.ET.221.01.1.1]TGP87696.1 hypothetical protein EN865_28185 [bacterium M00.F.Ca.ET.222.01.1.1]TGT64462.1 hypothetical protein EN802_32620 [bacterium M00.F.Ca.ET.159.01.1.1]TGT79300.1 hypothetical protein EN800_31965 [bacterium M00.F.Ca.ET.157.01.1.1]TGT97109.1 hypothetical protein EN806_500